MSVSPQVPSPLEVDLALEHAAIVQYVMHGVQLRDVGLTDSVRPQLDHADVFLSK